eukprot:TRINITY_DN2432_c0_g1_i1.p1 TRINITY_DN2432_c0_g1~~TRINITY_DN2432_c0_g1_i1.p1  ORF type:complete len:107 (+),score=4.11 TRINITY_DN2432_c0_g1_i1:124-444(+)
MLCRRTEGLVLAQSQNQYVIGCCWLLFISESSPHPPFSFFQKISFLGWMREAPLSKNERRFKKKKKCYLWGGKKKVDSLQDTSRFYFIYCCWHCVASLKHAEVGSQ